MKLCLLSFRPIATVGACAAFSLASVACNPLLNAEAYRFDAEDAAVLGTAGPNGDDAGDAGDARAPGDAETRDGCVNTAGFGQRGCYACPPTIREQFLNECTGATCVPFDDPARISLLGADGGLPPLPPEIDAGTDAGPPPPPPADGGVPDGGTGNPLCSTLPSPIYAAGSTAIKPFLARVALVLGMEQKTIVYQSQGSCVGVNAILNGAPLTGTGANGPSYWDPTISDPTLAERQCDLDPGGNAADIGVSDVFATTCISLPQGLPSNVGDFSGPVQVMTMVVPAASTQQNISASAAYLVFGFGDHSGVAPWTDEHFIFQRNPSSGTQNMIAAAIGVPASRWLGQPNKGSTNVVSSLAAVPMANVESAIGILSSDIVDGNRAQLRALAYQDYGQSCVFWPDSTPMSEDKQNVRDGHYPIFGPLHLLAHVSNQGVPSTALVNRTLGYLTGTVALPNGVNLVQLYAQAHLVPVCAMHVTRSSDGGPLRPYAPPQPCNCYFDSLVTGNTQCKSCNASAECPADSPNCSFGYCEH